jgi:hypothetical protein
MTMSEDTKGNEVVDNEVVKAMGKDLKPDVPAGLAVVPKGTNMHALARRTTGEIVQNELEFHCGACGWNKSLHFEPDEMAALDNDIRGYTGPCPGCQCMTLTPKDAYWGGDFPSMSALAQKNKRAEARVQAEEFVDVVAEKVGDMMTGGIPKPTIEDPAPGAGPPDKADLPEIDISKLTPR